jgi:cyclophilin family peptidyl-prolyl cis-trans isomerase
MKSSHCVLQPAVAALALFWLHSPRATEVAICTDAGRFTVELDEQHAPLHVQNFLNYIDDGHYSGTVFHRVIEGFMIQGGGFDTSFRERPTAEAVRNESRNGLRNIRGAVAAARTSDPHSAKAQFFINVVDNRRLDGSANEWGYTVFGRVAEGMETVDAIAARPTGDGGPFPSDVPTPLATIVSAARIEPDALEDLPVTERADRMLEQIHKAVAEEAPDSTLEWIGRYRSTCAALEPDILIAEASAASALGRPARARYALEQYFAKTNAEDPNYEQAMALYASVAPDGPLLTPRFPGCRAPQAPEVPDGSVEDLAGMLEGQAAVQSFMRQSSTYLECLDLIIDDEKKESRQRETALVEYNRVVDVTQDLGNRFNEQVRTFRARQ